MTSSTLYAMTSNHSTPHLNPLYTPPQPTLHPTSTRTHFNAASPTTSQSALTKVTSKPQGCETGFCHAGFAWIEGLSALFVLGLVKYECKNNECSRLVTINASRQ